MVSKRKRASASSTQHDPIQYPPTQHAITQPNHPSVAISSGPYLLTLCKTAALIHETPTGKSRTLPLRHSLLHPSPLTSAALTPDATRLVTGCSDGTIRLWNLSARPHYTTLLRADANVEAQSSVLVAISPSAQYVLAAHAKLTHGLYNTLLSFRADDGWDSQSLRGRARRVAVADDGCVAVSITTNSTARLLVFRGDSHASFRTSFRNVTFWDLDSNGMTLIMVTSGKDKDMVRGYNMKGYQWIPTPPLSFYNISAVRLVENGSFVIVVTRTKGVCDVLVYAIADGATVLSIPNAFRGVFLDVTFSRRPGGTAGPNGRKMRIVWQKESSQPSSSVSDPMLMFSSFWFSLKANAVDKDSAKPPNGENANREESGDVVTDGDANMTGQNKQSSQNENGQNLDDGKNGTQGANHSDEAPDTASYEDGKRKCKEEQIEADMDEKGHVDPESATPNGEFKDSETCRGLNETNRDERMDLERSAKNGTGSTEESQIGRDTNEDTDLLGKPQSSYDSLQGVQYPVGAAPCPVPARQRWVQRPQSDQNAGGTSKLAQDEVTDLTRADDDKMDITEADVGTPEKPERHTEAHEMRNETDKADGGVVVQSEKLNTAKKKGNPIDANMKDLDAKKDQDVGETDASSGRAKGTVKDVNTGSSNYARPKSSDQSVHSVENTAGNTQIPSRGNVSNGKGVNKQAAVVVVGEESGKKVKVEDVLAGKTDEGGEAVRAEEKWVEDALVISRGKFREECRLKEMKTLTNSVVFLLMCKIAGTRVAWLGEKEIAKLVYTRGGKSNSFDEDMFVELFRRICCIVRQSRRERWKALFTEARGQDDHVLIFHAMDLVLGELKRRGLEARTNGDREGLDDLFQEEAGGFVMDEETFIRAADKVYYGRFAKNEHA